jgi:hypothetical protein
MPCSQADIAAAEAAPQGSAADGSKLSWDAPKQEEDLSKQPQHAKVRPPFRTLQAQPALGNPHCHGYRHKTHAPNH